MLQDLLGRLKHITAIMLDDVYSEHFISLRNFQYNEDFFYVTGEIIRSTGDPGTVFKIRFPARFVNDDITDEEVMEWREL